MLLAAGFAATRPGFRPPGVARAAEGAALAALAAAVGSLGVLIGFGPGSAGIGPAVRLDPVSATMLLLVAFVGWIVVRYARTYLDGEARQGAFTGWLCATLASVMLLVTAGNLVQLVLAWIAAGAALHRLLVFYPERAGAQRAARKKAFFSVIGSVALAGAAGLLAIAHGTVDIAAINASAAQGGTWGLVAAGLLAVAAVLKSAQFPTHGWLTEVMEAPTPVSALLHAGVVNAGGFLLIRLADVMIAAPGVLAGLAMLGGFTAIFGAAVMLTQPAVKTALAWSTVAQMGFMVLQCGLALFPLALLHIVAHSLYKAHAFLSSGGAVAEVAANRRPGPVAVPGGRAVGRAFVLALCIYGAIGAAFGLVFGFGHKSPQALVLGGILILGVAYLVAQGLAEAAPRALTRRTSAYAAAAAVGYFALQTAAEWLTSGTLPATPAPGRLEWVLMVLAILSFGLVAVVQAMLPLWSGHPAAAALRVHLSNGFYVNVLMDRFLRKGARA